MDRHGLARGITALTLGFALGYVGTVEAQGLSAAASVCAVTLPLAAGDPRGGGGNVLVVDCTGANGAFTTIQSAVDAATDGDEIVIIPNNCNSQVRWTEAVAIVGKGLTLRSTNPEDPAIVAATILGRGIGTNTIVRFDAAGATGAGGEPLQFIVDGLTIRDGDNSMAGGGIDTTGGAVTIRRCALRNNNHATLFRIASAVRVDDCRFENNRSASVQAIAAAIAAYQSRPVLVTNCTFLGNTTRVVEIDEPFAPDPAVQYYGRLEGCRFENNSGLVLTGDSIDVFDCAFITNTGSCILCDRLNIDESEFTANSGNSKSIECLEQATIANSSFSMNAGSMIRCSSASLELQNCDFSDHTGLRCIDLVDSLGSISDCLFSNLAGSAVSGYLDGPMIIERCEVLGSGVVFGPVMDISSDSITVRDSDFIGNMNNSSRGGAMYLQGGTIERCRFEGNSTIDSGGAIYSFGTLMIRNSQFLGNSAIGPGGAISMSAGSVTDCLIAGNTSQSYSGAIRCTAASASGCTIVGNRNFVPNSTLYVVQLTDSIVWGNRCIADEAYDNAVLALGVKYSLVDGPITRLVQVMPIVSDTIIDGEPGFIDPGSWDDMGTPEDRSDDLFVLGDYHLRPDSPCIDGGFPAFIPTPGEEDLDGDERVQGCRVDMGADEFTDTGYVIGDINGDGFVTLDDLPAFVAKLLAPRGPGSCAADTNGDGRTDGLDVAEMISLLTGV